MFITRKLKRKTKDVNMYQCPQADLITPEPRDKIELFGLWMPNRIEGMSWILHTANLSGEPWWLTSSIQDSSELVTNKTTKHAAQPKRKETRKPHKLIHTYSLCYSLHLVNCSSWTQISAVHKQEHYSFCASIVMINTSKQKDSDYQKLWHYTFSTRSL
jgi:S-methylmethionine-dependent homocysteine/selenocysteine methylase